MKLAIICFLWGLFILAFFAKTPFSNTPSTADSDITQSKQKTTISKIIGVSILTIYTFTFLFAVYVCFFDIQIWNQRTVMLFEGLGIASFILLLIWIYFSHKKLPARANISLRIMALSIPIYLMMTFPKVS